VDRVEEIEAAIAGLPPEEYRRLVDWESARRMRCARSRKAIRDREQTRWDEQMDRDSTSGKLDFLFREAEDESAQGLVREWPPPQ
jgi:hypothetical protein